MEIIFIHVCSIGWILLHEIDNLLSCRNCLEECGKLVFIKRCVAICVHFLIKYMVKKVKSCFKISKIVVVLRLRPATNFLVNWAEVFFFLLLTSWLEQRIDIAKKKLLNHHSKGLKWIAYTIVVFDRNNSCDVETGIAFCTVFYWFCTFHSQTKFSFQVLC